MWNGHEPFMVAHIDACCIVPAKGSCMLHERQEEARVFIIVTLNIVNLPRCIPSILNSFSHTPKTQKAETLPSTLTLEHGFSKSQSHHREAELTLSGRAEGPTHKPKATVFLHVRRVAGLGSRGEGLGFCAEGLV